jgi:hypothetical protein
MWTGSAEILEIINRELHAVYESAADTTNQRTSREGYHSRSFPMV